MQLKFKKGFSLTEIIVALFITSIIGITLLSLNESANRDFRQITETNKLQTEAEMIFAMIEHDLELGGFVHPIRGDVDNGGNCLGPIDPEDAVFADGDLVSACYDKYTEDGASAFRYLITYRIGDPNGSMGADAEDETTLYKRVIRTDTCKTNDAITSLSADEDPNLLQTIHGFKPVSSNVGDIEFSFSNIGNVERKDILDIDIQFQSNDFNEYKLNFRKSIFVSNKLLEAKNFRCANRCPNSKVLFSSYEVADKDINDNFPWDPDTREIPAARILISENYVDGEDFLEWDAAVEASSGLNVNFNDDIGALEISGDATGTAYQNFIRTVRYVNLEDDKDDRTYFADPDKRIVLTLGFMGICDEVLGRLDEAEQHFYCYIKMNNGVNESANLADPVWPVGRNNGWPWWTQAQLRAESTNYYNLKGYLTTITSLNEKEFILEKIRENGTTPPIWLGGSDNDMEGEWKWVSGPESIALGIDTDDPPDAYSDPPGIRSNWTESCLVDGVKKQYGQEDSANTADFCYPGFGGLGVGVYYRDDGGSLCREEYEAWGANCVADEAGYEHNPYDPWPVDNWGINSQGRANEPNDCCQNRNAYAYNSFAEFDRGEIIPDTFANRYLGRYNNLEATALLEGTKRNGIALSSAGDYATNKGNLYYNTDDGEFKAWNGGEWVIANNDDTKNINAPTRRYNDQYYEDAEKPPNRFGAGEHFMQFRSDGRWNDLYIDGHTGGSLETRGFVAEWSSDWVTTQECSDQTDDHRYACVNYYNQFDLILDDFTYTQADMLDFCDLNPGLPGDGIPD